MSPQAFVIAELVIYTASGSLSGGAAFRMLNPRRKLFVIGLLALGGCSPTAMVEKFADDAKEQIAQQYVQRLIKGDTAALAAEVDAALKKPELLGAVEQMRALLPREAPVVTNLVGYQVHHRGGGSIYNLTYQFGYGTKWVLVNVAWRESGTEPRVIMGLQVQPLPEPLETTHALSLRRAGPRHYVFLAAMCASASFVVITLIACIRTKFPRRKWLWILFVLFGLVRFSLNWTTGEVSYSVLSFLLFGAGAFAPTVYSPWTVSFALPIGALVFWLKRPKALAQAAALPSD